MDLDNIFTIKETIKNTKDIRWNAAITSLASYGGYISDNEKTCFITVFSKKFDETDMIIKDTIIEYTLPIRLVHRFIKDVIILKNEMDEMSKDYNQSTSTEDIQDNIDTEILTTPFLPDAASSSSDD